MRKLSKALGIAALLGSVVVSNSVYATAYYSNQSSPDLADGTHWNTVSCAGVAASGVLTPVTHDYTLCATHTLAALGVNTTVNGLATVATGVVTGNSAGVLTVATGFTNAGTFTGGAGGLTITAGGLTNSGTFTNSGGGALTVTAGGVANTGTITGGTGTMTVSGGAFVNSGTGTLTTSAAMATQAFTLTAGTVTIGAGITVTDLTPTAGTLALNADMTISGDIATGAATVSGTGSMILTDANHTITGPVNVRNLSIATLTAARTITMTNTVTEVGTTVLNGVAGFLITLSAGTITPAIVSNYCTGSTTANVTCNATPPVAATAPFASASLLWLFGGALGLFGLFGLNRTRKTAA